MKEKKPLYKKWWFWLLIVIVFLGIISPKKSSKYNDSPKASTSYNNEVKEELNTIESVISTEHEAWNEIETSDNGLKISYKDISTHWDENSLIRDSISNYVKISQAVYLQNVDCKYTDFYVFIDMTDSKGNVSQTKGINIKMTQEEFNTYNWENLEYTNIFEQFKNSCEVFYIAPGIEANIDTEKIYYH